MINSVTLHVRLGRDPEVRDAGGKKVCSVSAAMSQGRDKPSLWLELTAWGDNRFAHEDLQALQKGQACVVQGRLTVREYEKDGQKREAWSLEVKSLTLLGGARDRAEAEEEMVSPF